MTAPSLFDRAAHQPATLVTVGSALYLAYWRGFADGHSGGPTVAATGDEAWDRYYADGLRLGRRVERFAPKSRRLPIAEVQ